MMIADNMENRNMGCSCGNNNNDNMCPFNSDNMSTVYVMNNNDCDESRMDREEMMKHIKCYQFAIIELALYLDTHPDDSKALCLHRKYSRELKDLTDKYQKVYGPLTINYPCNKWRWLEEPWPWERGIM